jgi:large subunit ribosomal protein L35
MPKMKSCKAVSKRIKMTANGKLFRRKPCKSHLMSAKNAKRRRALRHPAEITSKPFIKKLSRLIDH